jgi:hypothetical protein
MAQEIILDNKHGHCIYCNARCFIECSKCYAILTYHGEWHNCPDGDYNNDNHHDFEKCDECYNNDNVDM